MLEWTLPASVLTLLVIGLRYLLRGKISSRLQYALWTLVLLRLLLPFSIGSSRVSVSNLTATAKTQTPASLYAISAPLFLPDAQQAQQPVSLPDNAAQSAAVQSTQPYAPDEVKAAVQSAQTEPTAPSAGELLQGIWLGGIGAIGLFFMLVNLRFYVRVRRTRRKISVIGRFQRVYVTAAVDTPCLFGLFRPAVYLQPEAAQDETILRHTVAHELTHLRHGDPGWSVLRCACLALHWFNPLVWWAAILSRRDSELACDAATVKRLGEEERAAYGKTLIEMTRRSENGIFLTATTVSGGRSGLRERIVLLAKKPKTSVYSLLAVLLIAAVAVGCTFTGTKEKTLATDNTDATAKMPYSASSEQAVYILEEAPYYRIYQTVNSDTEKISLFYEILSKDGSLVCREQTRTYPGIQMENEEIMSIRIGYGTGISKTRFYLAEQGFLTEEYDDVIAFCGQSAACLYYDSSWEKRGVVVQNVLNGEVSAKQQLDFSQEVMPIQSAVFSDDGTLLEIRYLFGEDRQEKSCVLTTHAQTIDYTPIVGTQSIQLDDAWSTRLVPGSQLYPIDRRLCADIQSEDISNYGKSVILRDATTEWSDLVDAYQALLESFAQTYVDIRTGEPDATLLPLLQQSQTDWVAYREKAVESRRVLMTEKNFGGSTGGADVQWLEYNLYRERALELYKQCVRFGILQAEEAAGTPVSSQAALPEAYRPVAALFQQMGQAAANGSLRMTLENEESLFPAPDAQHDYHWSCMVIELVTNMDLPEQETPIRYQLLDLNADGTDELILTKNDGEILAIYKKNPDGEAVLLDAFWSRYTAAINAAGQVFVQSSSGAGHYAYELYQVAPRETQLELVQSFVRDGSEFYQMKDGQRTAASEEEMLRFRKESSG